MAEEKKQIEFTKEDAEEIANELARNLILNVTSINGNLPGIMTTLNILQALVIKNCLVIAGDGMNMPRGDTMIEMSADNAKTLIRGLSERVTN